MAVGHLPASAAILAGGLGTRLRSVVADQPKVLAPIHGRPFLTYLLDQLAEMSVDEVVLLTGYQAKQVRESLGPSYSGMRLAYSEEPAPLGTAGALRWALAKLVQPTILLLNGDSFCAVDFARFGAFHEREAADASMVLARTIDGSRFGSVRATPDGRITRFAEKTCAGRRPWINAGIYLLRRRLIEGLPPGEPLSLEHDLFPAWVDRHRCCGFRSTGRFLDIGTPESYAEAERFFEAPLGKAYAPA